MANGAAVATDAILELRDLHTHFHTPEGTVRAVDGVSYSLKAGETLGVVGESGCGKTVTALSVLRLIPEPPGEIFGDGIFFEGRDLTKLGTRELRKPDCPAGRGNFPKERRRGAYMRPLRGRAAFRLQGSHICAPQSIGGAFSRAFGNHPRNRPGSGANTRTRRVIALPNHQEATASRPWGQSRSRGQSAQRGLRAEQRFLP